MTANKLARRPHRLGPDAEGRLPALQGAARLRPALPERLRLPGPLDRGRASSARSGSTRSARSRSTGSRSSRAAAARSSSVVAGASRERLHPPRPVDGLGQRLLHLQRHEHRVHLAVPEARARARLALPRPPLDRVVPSLRHVALAARAVAGGRLPGPRRPVALRAPAAPRPARRVARRLDDDAVDAARERRRRRQARRGVRPARERRVGRRRPLPRRGVRRSGSAARSWSAGATRAPSTSSGPAGEVEHRVIPWDEVTLDEGTGIVHIAPGCGAEDFELSQDHDLPVLTPVDEAGRFYDDYGWLHGLSTVEAADQIVGDLAERGLLVEAGLYEHRYPHCWRCDTPLIFRLSDDWFISVEELRPQLLDANAGRRVDARVHGQAHGRLAPQHGRLEHLAAPLLRAAAALLPVRLRSPERDRVEGRAGGARAARPRPARGAAPPLDRRGADRAASSAARRCAGSPRSATSGSTPASSPSRRSAGRTRSASERATRPGAAKGLTTADLPDHAYWEEWFPADWVSEMREQIRLWFYSQLFMSVVLTGGRRTGRCSATRRCSTRPAARCTARGGTRSRPTDAFARMGADVMRWQFCAQPPDRNLLFGFGPGARDQAQAADALELGPLPRRLRRASRASGRDWDELGRGRRAAAARPLARRRGRAQLVARGDRRRTRPS